LTPEFLNGTIVPMITDEEGPESYEGRIKVTLLGGPCDGQIAHIVDAPEIDFNGVIYVVQKRLHDAVAYYKGVNTTVRA
jgi:hypothetical protein